MSRITGHASAGANLRLYDRNGKLIARPCFKRHNRAMNSGLIDQYRKPRPAKTSVVLGAIAMVIFIVLVGFKQLHDSAYLAGSGGHMVAASSMAAGCPTASLESMPCHTSDSHCLMQPGCQGGGHCSSSLATTSHVQLSPSVTAVRLIGMVAVEQLIGFPSSVFRPPIVLS